MSSVDWRDKADAGHKEKPNGHAAWLRRSRNP
jgi:hypothetical protein